MTEEAAKIEKPAKSSDSGATDAKAAKAEQRERNEAVAGFADLAKSHVETIKARIAGAPSGISFKFGKPEITGLSPEKGGKATSVAERGDRGLEMLVRKSADDSSQPQKDSAELKADPKLDDSESKTAKASQDRSSAAEGESDSKMDRSLEPVPEENKLSDDALPGKGLDSSLDKQANMTDDRSSTSAISILKRLMHKNVSKSSGESGSSLEGWGNNRPSSAVPDGAGSGHDDRIAKDIDRSVAEIEREIREIEKTGDQLSTRLRVEEILKQPSGSGIESELLPAEDQRQLGTGMQALEALLQEGSPEQKQSVFPSAGLLELLPKSSIQDFRDFLNSRNGMESLHDAVIKQIVEPDGTVVTQTGDGSRTTTVRPDGRVEIQDLVKLAGGTYFRSPDGAETIRYRDGSAETLLSNGTKITDSNGRLTVTERSGHETTSFPDGTVMVTDPPAFGGKTQINLPDGTRVLRWTDGSSQTIQPDGTRIIEDGNEKSRTVQHPDGTQTVSYLGAAALEAGGIKQSRSADGTYTIHMRDGASLTEHPDGTIERESRTGEIMVERTSGARTIAMPSHLGGVLETSQADGTFIRQWPNGATETWLPNGGKVSESPDGTRMETSRHGVETLTRADGTTITTYPERFDGSVTTRRPDGEIRTVWMDGSNETQKPDGTRIFENAADGSRLTTHLDGTRIREYSSSLYHDVESPDGAYSRVYRSGHRTIVNADGSGERIDANGNSLGKWGASPHLRAGLHELAQASGNHDLASRHHPLPVTPEWARRPVDLKLQERMPVAHVVAHNLSHPLFGQVTQQVAHPMERAAVHPVTHPVEQIQARHVVPEHHVRTEAVKPQNTSGPLASLQNPSIYSGTLQIGDQKYTVSNGKVYVESSFGGGQMAPVATLERGGIMKMDGTGQIVNLRNQTCYLDLRDNRGDGPVRILCNNGKQYDLVKEMQAAKNEYKEVSSARDKFEEQRQKLLSRLLGNFITDNFITHSDTEKDVNDRLNQTGRISGEIADEINGVESGKAVSGHDLSNLAHFLDRSSNNAAVLADFNKYLTEMDAGQTSRGQFIAGSLVSLLLGELKAFEMIGEGTELAGDSIANALGDYHSGQNPLKILANVLLPIITSKGGDLAGEHVTWSLEHAIADLGEMFHIPESAVAKMMLRVLEKNEWIEAAAKPGVSKLIDTLTEIAKGEADPEKKKKRE